MTQELFQPEIGVKNGLDGKIRLARAEARSLVAKRSIFKTVAATAADMGGGKGGGRYGRRQRWRQIWAAAKVAMFEAVVFADQRLLSQP